MKYFTAKYDDFQWHINEGFPKELDETGALTHIGMFMGWVIDNGFESALLRENFQRELRKFKKRKITGSEFLALCCDGRLTSDDLNEEANLFAQNYYATDEYFNDYVSASDDNCETIFHEEDSWDNYYKIKKIIQEKDTQWRGKTVSSADRKPESH
jgi:hypothetical protein